MDWFSDSDLKVEVVIGEVAGEARVCQQAFTSVVYNKHDTVFGERLDFGVIRPEAHSAMFAMVSSAFGEQVTQIAWTWAGNARTLSQTAVLWKQVLHEQNWIHRGIKLENVLVVCHGGADCRLALGDFDAACFIKEDGSLDCGPIGRRQRGTLDHLSPEHFLRKLR
eukprot:CAMPEP_0170283072 /NCGR_PEP_ID=MMETSP0116_2-20130129/41563_1 /TAXON_ID=400756 /ORGANISM="Durinskia baltica, Strain CSIRO CS-38" /LENGTH=165 /DNA_ID=CAMNT_0010534429 /DNA_START=45 /DNA_END=540 /DNA_ORIENTATION=+